MCMMCELGYGPAQEPSFGKIGLQKTGFQVSLGGATASRGTAQDSAAFGDDDTSALVASGGSAGPLGAVDALAALQTSHAAGDGSFETPDVREPWWINDQTPENPYGKEEDYEGFLDYLGALPRSITPEIARRPVSVNVSELADHPDYQEAAVGSLTMWASVTPFEFEIVDDAPFDEETQWIEVVSPELGERSDGSAFSSDRFVSVGQRFHDTEPELTELGGYVFNTFVHEFGHEFGLNHPGLYNYSGPGGVQIN